MSADGKSGLQLRSLIKKSGELEISLLEVPTPEPSVDEVVVRVEAAPINPSDLGLLVGAADMSTAKAATKKPPMMKLISKSPMVSPRHGCEPSYVL